MLTCLVDLSASATKDIGILGAISNTERDDNAINVLSSIAIIVENVNIKMDKKFVCKYIYYLVLGLGAIFDCVLL